MRYGDAVVASSLARLIRFGMTVEERRRCGLGLALPDGDRSLTLRLDPACHTLLGVSDVTLRWFVPLLASAVTFVATAAFFLGFKSFLFTSLVRLLKLIDGDPTSDDEKKVDGDHRRLGSLESKIELIWATTERNEKFIRAWCMAYGIDTGTDDYQLAKQILQARERGSPVVSWDDPAETGRRPSTVPTPAPTAQLKAGGRTAAKKPGDGDDGSGEE